MEAASKAFAKNFRGSFRGSRWASDLPWKLPLTSMKLKPKHPWKFFRGSFRIRGSFRGSFRESFRGSFRGSFSAVTFQARDARFTPPKKKNAHTLQDPHHRISRAFLGAHSCVFKSPCLMFGATNHFLRMVFVRQHRGRKQGFCFDTIHIIKTKIHSSCEIEDFRRNSSLQAVCDTPIARITGCVSSWTI